MAVDAKTGQAIFPGATSVGLRNVGSYQVSGHPFITGSTLATDEEKHVTFPYVTKNITVIASGSGANIRLHFHPISSCPQVVTGKHYITLDTDEDALTLDVKCKELWVSATAGGADRGFELMASLTNIPTQSMYTVSGSGVTDGPGD
jgi:hypothetical protein